MVVFTRLQSQFAPDPKCYVPIDPDLKCGEEWMGHGACSCREGGDDDDVDDGDDGLPIAFHVALPRNDARDGLRLTFRCRDASSGVLLPAEPRAAPEDVAEGRSTTDPFFFERGFSLEAMTGFQAWPGSRLMTEAFACANGGGPGAKRWRERLLSNEGLNVLEVGAGIGVCGTCLAAGGANVIATDLPLLVNRGVRPNLRRNAAESSESSPSSDEAPADALDYFGPLRSTKIGEGRASASVLDWFKPVSEQLPLETSSAIDVIVGCDCMFLRKLVDPLLNVVRDIFQLSERDPKFLFTFQRRNMTGVFTGLEELLELIGERGWSVECLAWRTISVEGDGNHDLYLFEVSPGKTPKHCVEREEKNEVES